MSNFFICDLTDFLCVLKFYWTARVKAATSHLTGLKIGIMGCIVNGPGEMADADYGYVGAGVGRISLYKGKECVQRNIPENEAVERLVELIKENGDWKN